MGNETLQLVELALDKNPQLKDNLDMSSQIYLLATIFHKQFPNVSLENLAKRIEDVMIVSGSKYIYKEPVQYEVIDNMIIINEELSQNEDIDFKHQLMKCMLQMISAKNQSYGFIDSKLEALNVGFNEIIANNLVGNDGESTHLDEQMITNIISNAIGLDKMTSAFFTNNSELVMKELLDRCGNTQTLDSFLEQLNHNMYARTNLKESRLYPLIIKLSSFVEVREDLVVGGIHDEGVSYPGYDGVKDILVTSTSKGLKK